jgi:hypothetical protein
LRELIHAYADARAEYRARPSDVAARNVVLATDDLVFGYLDAELKVINAREQAQAFIDEQRGAGREASMARVKRQTLDTVLGWLR